jgi:hypothetical protein
MCGAVFNADQRDDVAMSPKKETRKSAKSATATDRKSKGFNDEERAAMKERAQELKAEARRQGQPSFHARFMPPRRRSG